MTKTDFYELKKVQKNIVIIIITIFNYLFSTNYAENVAETLPPAAFIVTVPV